MSESQALWRLAEGEALSFKVGPGARELRVSSGRLWLTQPGRPEAPSEDVWLQAGQSLALASGSQVVIEAWPQADFQLLVPPSACPALQARQRESRDARGKAAMGRLLAAA
ncbi:DUF2917 domain-containing protein [Paucibacter sp. DJ1R-11]|uniref:DUF2917 domain-containing protein n=1 Tax=Paucibacter sp. DJ1R-11 TaxID=2893556 RepID=UPI0021E3676E|nr:DUF2917 domain-containing protein [Paucibacter sp. DJ1R-11]MCV2362028.1 DUF2917 domain-containing protein [Paucibacter sp. DJ1R-11]